MTAEEAQFVSLTPWSGDVVIEVEAEPAWERARARQGKGQDATVVGKEQMSHLGELVAKPRGLRESGQLRHTEGT